MQSSGEHNLLQRLKGNRLERAIEGNNCPVLSVQEHLDVEALKKLTVAVDLDSDYETENLKIIKQLAACFQSEITLLHIKSENVDPVELNNKALHFRKKFGFEGCTVHFMQSEDVDETIVRYSEHSRTGLIALITKAPGGILRIFTNSTSETVANSSPIPVLTIND
jgi:nucleotide-binding universal stress UspA family protein